MRMRWLSLPGFLFLPLALQAEVEKVKLLKIQALAEGAIVTEWQKASASPGETSTNSIFVTGLPEAVASGDTWEGFVVRDGAYATEKGFKIPKYSVSDSLSKVKKTEPIDLKQNVYIVKSDKGSGTGFRVKLDGKEYFITNLHVVDGASAFQVYNQSGLKLSIPKQFEVDLDADLFRFETDMQEGLVPAAESEIGEQVIAYGNSQGSDVLTESKGKILGIGPDQIEVSCDIVQGNSGGPIVNKSGLVVGIATYLTLDKNQWNKGSRFSEVRKFGLKIKDNQNWCLIPKEAFFKDALILGRLEESLEQIVGIAFESAKYDQISPRTLASTTADKRAAQQKVDVAIQTYNRPRSSSDVYWIFFQKLAEACDVVVEENRAMFWNSEWAKARAQRLSERGKEYASGIRDLRAVITGPPH